MVALAKPKQDNRKTRENPTGREGEWESVRLAATSRRRWKWALIAGALIASGGVAGAWAGLAPGEARTVAVLSADLPAGHVLTAEDVTAVETEAVDGLRLLTPETVEGMALTKPVPEGSPLVAGAVSNTALWPEPGQALVAVPVATLPQDMQPGSTVDLITTQSTSDETAEDVDAEAEVAEGVPGVATGLVHRVATDTEDEFSGGQKVVEILLPRGQAADLSRAAVGGDVQIVVVNPQEDEPSDAEGEGDA